MNNRMTVIKSTVICCVIIAIMPAFVALVSTVKPRYLPDPTELFVSESPMVTETTVETTVPTESTKLSEATVEETTVETPAPAETTKPSVNAAPKSKTKETTKPAKATTKKKSTKKSIKKTSRKSSDEDWDGYDDDDAKPTKKPTKIPNTPTPKPFKYCTCDAEISCGSTAAGTFHKFTMKGLTAEKLKSGLWEITDASDDKVRAYLKENYPGYGRYGVGKLKNKRDYRYKP